MWSRLNKKKNVIYCKIMKTALLTLVIVLYTVSYKQSTMYNVVKSQCALCILVQCDIPILVQCDIPSLHSAMCRTMWRELCNMYTTQWTGDIHPKLVQCWASVADDGPSLYRHWVNVSCLLRKLCHLNNIKYTFTPDQPKYGVSQIMF